MSLVDLSVFFFFFFMRRRPPRATQSRSSAASDVYKRQGAVLFHRMRPGVGRLQTDNAVLFWSDEHAGALCDVQPERYGLVSKIQSAGAVRLSARIAVRGCRYGGGCGSAGCQKETGKAVEPPCPRYPGMKKPQRQQALRLHVLLCSQCNLRFWKHLGYTPRFKTAWVLVPFPYFRNTGFCISYF